MAATIEIATQFSKDLRSEAKEYKRGRDATQKWHWGTREKPGSKPNIPLFSTVEWETADCQNGKPTNLRPGKKPQKCTCCNSVGNHNIVKTRGNWDMPQRRVMSVWSAVEEMKDPDLTRSYIDEVVPDRTQPQRRRAASVSDNGLLYSFDSVVTPGAPTSLEQYVRPSAKPGRETEKLVSREYEVLDDKGDVVRGRKARATLARKHDSAPEALVEEEDDFELV